jgi:hypothetical protein
MILRLTTSKRGRDSLMACIYWLVDLMKEVEENLPLFRAVFSSHDNPNVVLTTEMKRQAVEVGKSHDCAFSPVSVFREFLDLHVRLDIDINKDCTHTVYQRLTKRLSILLPRNPSILLPTHARKGRRNAKT